MFVGCDGLGGGVVAAVLRADEAVEVALLDGLADGFVGGDEVFGGGEVFGGPLVEVGADAEASLHGDEEAVGGGGDAGGAEPG